MPDDLEAIKRKGKDKYILCICCRQAPSFKRTIKLEKNKKQKKKKTRAILVISTKHFLFCLYLTVDSIKGYNHFLSALSAAQDPMKGSSTTE